MKIKNISGFTLLEIMVVILIIGLFLMVTVPRFGSIKDQFRLETFAKDCLADIRYTQQMSIDTKQSYSIIFNSTGYSIQDSGANVVKSVDYDDGISYQGIEGTMSNQIIFDSTGAPSISGKIDFKNASDTIVHINVTPSTGEVSMSWD